MVMDVGARDETDAVLADGGTVHLRPIRPEDSDALVAFHESLSDRTVYFRFFSCHRHLSAREVERFTTVDGVDRVAIVATLGGVIAGIGRYDRVSGGPDAEVAFVVADQHQGRGLGTLLLEHLAAVARANGVTSFVAETLPDNRRMIGVFQHAGFAATHTFDRGVVHVSFPIDPAPVPVAEA